MLSIYRWLRGAAGVYMRKLFVLALAMLVAGCANVQSVPYASVAIDGARPPPVPVQTRLSFPNGPGPYPAVILLHSCQSPSSAEIYEWVDRLNSWGYAVAFPDSLTPRGQTSVCSAQTAQYVTARDRAGDAYGVALALTKVPQIDASRIAVLGISHGGHTAVEVTRKAFQTAYPGLIKAAVDYYGVCHDPRQHGTIPLLILVGDADTWGGAALCQRFVSFLKPTQPVELKIYPGVVHAFEYTRLWQEIPDSTGHPLHYNPEAAADSFARTREFLAHWMPADGAANPLKDSASLSR